MQNNAKNKWEKYNLNKGKRGDADAIYNSILPVEQIVMAGKLELTLPFKNGEKHFKITPEKGGYNVVLVGSKYNDLQYPFKIRNNIKEFVVDIINAIKKIKEEYMVAVEVDKMINEFFSKKNVNI